MPNSPKKVEETMQRALDAWSDLAPDKKFGNKSLADFQAQCEKSMAPRRKLTELTNEEKRQIAIRETEDKATMQMFEKIVAGIISDDDFGNDSAIYEAFGFVRKSDRKSGNTRRRTSTTEIQS